MKVRYGQQYVYLPLYVVEGGGPTLLGRSWLNTIRLDWGSMQVASVVAGLPIWSAQDVGLRTLFGNFFGNNRCAYKKE